MDHPTACGKVKEVMEEMVDGRRAPGEEIEAVEGEAGISLRLRLLLHLLPLLFRFLL